MLTHCYTWLDQEQNAQVRCFSADGRPIAICGHGLLCSGALWQQLGQNIRVLNTETHSVSFRAEQTAAWLCFPPMTVRGVPVPAWVNTLFPQPSPGAQRHPGPAIAAAEVGSAHDYLVLQWPGGADLRALRWPGAMLAKHTKRALIITCRSADGNANSAGYHDSNTDCIPNQRTGGIGLDPAETQAKAQALQIQLRYLAPQYSPAEDSATGSAMRVLASYWQFRNGVTRLDAWQRSAGGGLLRSEIDDQGSVWVGGNVFVRALRAPMSSSNTANQARNSQRAQADVAFSTQHRHVGTGDPNHTQRQWSAPPNTGEQNA